MKKKFLSLVLCIAMIISALPLTALTAFASVEGDWVYTYYTGYGVMLEEYTGNQAEITLPTTLGGNPVKGIDDSAFQMNSTLRKVVIPEGYLSINEDAFNYCSMLEELVVPSTMKSVAKKNHCFIECTKLKKVTVYYNPDATYGALHELATKIIIPAGVSRFSNNIKTFKAVTQYDVDAANETYVSVDGVIFTKDLTQLCRFPIAAETIEYTVPDGVITIGDYAFDGNKNLQTLTLPEGVERLMPFCFGYCYSLKTIYLPGTINYVGEYAFNGLIYDVLENVYLDFDLDAFNSGNYRDLLQYITKLHIGKDVGEDKDFGEIVANCYLANEYIVDDENEYYCSVDGVLFNKDMTEIISYPAYKQDKSYSIPETVQKLNSCAFFYTEYLEELTVPQGVTLIPEYEFESGSLKNIYLPDSIAEIGEGAFLFCEALERIDIPDSVTIINSETFEGCINLESVNLPDNLKLISYGAFQNCKKLTSIELPETVKNIGHSAFEGCVSLTSINLPEQLKKIESYTFGGCVNLKSVTVPDNVERIWNHAFYGCSSLESLILPKSVIKIDSKCLCDCSSLKEIYIYNRDLSVGDSALDGVNENCTVFGYANSTAPDIADEYNLNFIAITCEHENSQWVVVKEPSCSETGLEQLICDYCGEVLDERELETTAHSVKDWIIVKEPTYDEPGLEELRCSICGEVIATREIPMLIDDYEGFPDVAKDDWYYESVRYVDEKGFITGYQNGTFGPADALQRQDFVVILARIAGADLDSYTECPLSDVNINTYYGKAVAWAVDSGIIKGYDNGIFGVGDSITREQICTILYRYLGSPDVDTGVLDNFPDKGNISTFALDAMAWANANGVINGKADGTLAPTATASRAEIATIIMRMDLQGMFA